MTDHLINGPLCFLLAVAFWLTAWFKVLLLAVIALAAIIYQRTRMQQLTNELVQLRSRLKEQDALLFHGEEKEKKAKEEIVSAHSNTIELLSKLSHEIRTPMNGVIGMTAMLSGTPLNNEQTQYLDSISSCSESLLRSINNILTAYTPKAGYIPGSSREIAAAAETTAAQANAGFHQLSHVFASQYPLRILVAEDNRMNQELISMILARLGYTADIAQNGKEVMEMLKEKNYDLLFMDVQMPEMDGLEATRMVRLGRNIQPVIIAMTANAMPGDREACIRAGMDDYISKPLNIQELVLLLERWAPGINSKTKP